MAKKHLSRIMRRAWYLVKHIGMSIRLGMLEAWREYRETIAHARVELGKRARLVYEQSSDPVTWTEFTAHLLTWTRRVVLHDRSVQIITTPNLKPLVRTHQG